MCLSKHPPAKCDIPKNALPGETKLRYNRSHDLPIEESRPKWVKNYIIPLIDFGVICTIISDGEGIPITILCFWWPTWSIPILLEFRIRNKATYFTSQIWQFWSSLSFFVAVFQVWVNKKNDNSLKLLESDVCWNIILLSL